MQPLSVCSFCRYSLFSAQSERWANSSVLLVLKRHKSWAAPSQSDTDSAGTSRQKPPQKPYASHRQTQWQHSPAEKYPPRTYPTNTNEDNKRHSSQPTPYVPRRQSAWQSYKPRANFTDGEHPSPRNPLKSTILMGRPPRNSTNGEHPSRPNQTEPHVHNTWRPLSITKHKLRTLPTSYNPGRRVVNPQPRRSSNDNQQIQPTGKGNAESYRKATPNPRNRPPPSLWHSPGQKPVDDPKPQSRIDPNDIPTYFQTNVERWSEHRGFQRRLVSFGIPQDEVAPLISAFVSAVQSGELSTPEGHKTYHLARFGQDHSQDGVLASLNVIYSTIFFTWASDPAQQTILEKVISPSTNTTIQSLARAADRSHPEEEFTGARRMCRKIIMHVGPTNSGKTHNALRALAAAGSGVYAGPLRLLAHEIWERLNLGQIVPLGVEAVEPEPISIQEHMSNNGKTVSPAWTQGNPKYARACNMRTGEEQKIVDPDAPLLSCTVEMLSTTQIYDVAVIDEIQMISDGQRGGGWTQAVLGVCAKELHLCGEETAVPIIQALLKDTGDEIIVNRYQRLTPLVVEPESLGGDLSGVRKGDCIVTFRRSSIFALKRIIESRTKMKCAVVYGKLPPEVRSEQAALFNDPNSGYDVMIGSDAIGMGLNLKIRRVIFERVHKWDGGRERFLSTSQIKQIAGRAGRYGLHGDEKPGGYTTTLNEADMERLRNALDTTVPPLQFARLSPNNDTFTRLASVLPPSSSTETIYNAHQYITQLKANYRYSSMNAETLHRICDFIDTRGPDLTITDRLLFMLSPIPWRDDRVLDVISTFIRMYHKDMNVNLEVALQGTGFMDTLLQTENKMTSKMQLSHSSTALATLESFHKVLVVYLWMSFKQPLVYNNFTQATDLKARVEKALEWRLRSMTKNLYIRPAQTKDTPIPYSTLTKRRLMGLEKLFQAIL